MPFGRLYDILADKKNAFVADMLGGFSNIAYICTLLLPNIYIIDTKIVLRLSVLMAALTICTAASAKKRRWNSFLTARPYQHGLAIP